jgi:Phage integrase, N-terminal SAM-like domain.
VHTSERLGTSLHGTGGFGRPQLNKAVVQRYAAELRDVGMAPSSINQRLSAIRKLAAEAADNGALDPQVASGIRAVRGARREGHRTGNWLTREQARFGKLKTLIHTGATRHQTAVVECAFQQKIPVGSYTLADAVSPAIIYYRVVKRVRSAYLFLTDEPSQ